ncbi:metalloregulator ArsR/SmtB family transcription factor [Streptomyces sp. DSM 44915]|uniref:Metalloregulator ArsR/SmtB family transcription factor n=1 Tax=Streptomyces chisholmiae TaxID=3075540 RepID=A0ABU2JJS8_9ACTN|nr:metalloregulator ArsR/SmtB family transcription factor [Streptomyces sp. DSM 44915]MDT0265240.1 metalloregulator ArsR/SmtB family transcription factor [Streptomyces sp. DSM 44915]
MSALDVLADPTRRRIVELLADGGELNATAIAGRFASSRPAISQHLGVLVGGGVLTVRRAGTQRIYRLEPASLAEAGDWLSTQAQRWTRVLDALETALDEDTP